MKPLKGYNLSILDKTAGIGHCAQNLENKKADCSSRYLTEVPQDLHVDMINLDLSHNNLKNLTNTTFHLYSYLEELCLNYANIIFITSGTFYPLRHLKKLEVAHNPGLHLHADIFQRSYELQFLDLAASELNSFEFDVMEQLPQLGKLSLSHNEISNVHCRAFKKKEMVIDLTSNNVANLNRQNFAMDCMVAIFILTKNPIQVVHPDAIAALHVYDFVLGGYPLAIMSVKNLTLGVSDSVIKRLSIESSGLRQISPDTFAPLYNTTLEYLSLGSNKLILYPYVFANLSLLFELNLSECKLSILKPDYFFGMTSLHILKLTGNPFLNINPFNTTWHIGLLELHLLLYNINAINRFSFQGLDNLTKLSLCFRHSFTSNLEIELMNVRELEISEGECSNIIMRTPQLKYFKRDMVLDVVHHKTTYNFKHSQLVEIIELSDKAVPSFNLKHTFIGNLPKLTILNLRYNYIAVIPSGGFQNTPSVETLYLDSNNILVVHEGAFDGLFHLNELSLGDNIIGCLPDYFLRDTKALTCLQLGRNQLTYLNRDVFAHVKMLANLSLFDNKFVGLNQTIFDPIYSSLKSVDISWNELVCNCESKWLVIKLGLYMIRKNETLCSVSLDTLVPLRGKPISMFKPSEHCGLNITLTSFLIVISLTVAATFIICFHHRQEVRYKLYLIKLAIIGYREVYDARERHDFEYDINVMFMNGDKEWAEENLRPALEERLPNFRRIAFGDDNLMIGMQYLDAVYYNVEKSFKTILLMTRHAVRDHIFMTKFRIAMNHVTDTQTENMVLVFIEDIPDNELPYIVRLYLSGQGAYLSWEEDEEGQEYFWENISKHLTVNLRINHMIPPN